MSTFINQLFAVNVTKTNVEYLTTKKPTSRSITLAYQRRQLIPGDVVLIIRTHVMIGDDWQTTAMGYAWFSKAEFEKRFVMGDRSTDMLGRLAYRDITERPSTTE